MLLKDLEITVSDILFLCKFLPFWGNWVVPVGHESNSFPGDGSEGGLLQGGYFSEHPTKRMCTAAEDCAP